MKHPQLRQKLIYAPHRLHSISPPETCSACITLSNIFSPFYLPIYIPSMKVTTEVLPRPFYHVMHVVLLQYCYLKSSIRLSVCLSVCL